MVEKLKKFGNVQILSRDQQKKLTGGDLQTDVYCKDGTGFSIHPEEPFNPRTMCENYGGFDHFETYEV